MARQGRRSKRNLPEEPLELLVDRLSHEGRGIATNNGKVTFVEGGLPGEKVRARYRDSRARFDVVEVIEVLTPSIYRTVPRCRYFTVCGGCSLQHLSPQAQIAFKQDLLLEQLAHACGKAPDSFQLLEMLQGENYHYRRKARLAVRYVTRKGGGLVGFREKHGTFITDMTFCEVLVDTLANLIQPLRELVNQLEARQHIPQFEVACGEDGDSRPRVALVMRHLQALGKTDLEGLRQFAVHHGCDFYLQPGSIDSVHRLWPEQGEERLLYRLPEFNLTMQFHPLDFIQVNESVNRQAIALVIELLELDPHDRVLDLFCGLGNFTLPMSRFCQQVIGIEGSAGLVARARDNASFNGIENVSFEVADLCQVKGTEPWYDRGFDKVLLDPPRSGALEIIDWLGRLGARKIVYVSCNPATLARDAAQLLEQGYVLGRVGVMDMFPHTAHVESIAEFTRAA